METEDSQKYKEQVLPATKIDYEARLNHDQLEAVRHIDGPLLVIAGAGTGKTRTIIFRVAYLVESGIPQEQILLLTFTRRAAAQMLERSAALLNTTLNKVNGGTFHSFSFSILKKYATKVGFNTGFSIIDESDSKDVINYIRSSYGIKDKEKRFPNKDTLHRIFTRMVNRAESIEDILENEYPHFALYLPDVESLYIRYKEYKKEKGLMDYDDLLIYMRELLTENPPIRQKLSLQYRNIMVDEYQDTNLVQADIVSLLASEHQNVMVVGDDAQSIYSFRGANYKNILEFEKVFQGTKVVQLQENYRSQPLILDLANSVINQAMEGYQKALYSHKMEGDSPILVQAMNEREQARFIVQKILEYREEQIPLSHIAVLFRSGNHSYQLEAVLREYNIPFVKYGGFKFFETAHIKDVIAYLRVYNNPLDTIMAMRMLLMQEGIGSATAKKIAEWMGKQGSPLQFSGFLAKGKIAIALQRLEDFFEKLKRKKISVAEMLAEVINFYEPYLKSKFDDYNKRLRDLDHLVLIAENYDSIDEFLSQMALEPPNRSVEGVLAPIREEEDCLILSTIHSAKGLEWHSVFIISALDGLFPSLYTQTEEAMEEERRLMYVAITRAQENLHISYPIIIKRYRGSDFFADPSRFLLGEPMEKLQLLQNRPQFE